MKPFILAALPVSLVATAALAAPSAWTVDKARSSIAFSGTQTGAPFKGSFGQWDAAIRFDPADLAQSSVRVTLGMAGAKTGDATKDATLAEADWLDAARQPRATFVANKFESSGGNRYVARGTLTLKGKALPLALPFTLSINGDVATMRAQAKIDRIAYGVGTKTDATGTMVSRQITVDIALTARRAKN